jgi:hypothetical protein
MHILKIFGAVCVVALIACGCGVSSSPSLGGASGGSSGSILTGFAFVDSSVTGQGGGAKLPAGTKIYPSGTTFTGTTGCSTNQQHTDGEIVAVLDYNGRATAGSVTVTRHPASGGSFADAPYYLDLNPGRTLQFLGPIYANGTYDVLVSYDYNQGPGNKTSGSFVLSRNCPYN